MQLGSLNELIAQYVHDGQSVALEGFTHLSMRAPGSPMPLKCVHGKKSLHRLSW